MNHELAEKDLRHIRIVLGHLEREGNTSSATEAGMVSTLNYWRARIRAILTMPLLPLHIERQANDLLARLNQLEGARR